MAESEARRRLCAVKDVSGIATTLGVGLSEPMKFAIDPSGEAIRVVPTPSGARRRALTPGLPTKRTNQAADGKTVPPTPVPGECASPQHQMPRDQTGRLFFCVLGACLAAAGFFIVAAGMGTDVRGERLAIFREFLRRAEGFPPVPLPEALQAQPPQYLQAAWQPGGSRQPTHFQLKLLEVPLTAAVLGDAQEPGDEAGLLPSTNAEGVWRSKLYRAIVPVGDLWLAGLDPADRDLTNIIGAGVLRISLADGSTLLEHTFEPLRWLRSSDCHQGSDGSSCGGLSVAARLCYALPSGDGPWNGAETYDCEHSHRSPVYIPLQRHRQHHRGDVEIILRSRADIYVHASEVTHGCSNCQGRPYGSEASIGTDALACGMTNPAEHSMLNRVLDFVLGRRPCFGHPVQRLRSVGLSMLAFSCFSFILAISMKSVRE